MPQIWISILFSLASCAPLIFWRELDRKLRWLLPPLCLLLGILVLQFARVWSLGTYLAVLGVLYWLVLGRTVESGKKTAFCLCWCSAAAPLSIGYLLSLQLVSTNAAGFGAAVTAVLSGVTAAIVHWLSRWEFEDKIKVSEERSISPLPMLVILLVLLFGMSFAGYYWVLPSVAAIAVLGVLSLMLIALWNESALTIEHSQDRRDLRQEKLDEIDQASRVSAAELQRQLTESSNRLQQISLAYYNDDERALEALLNESADSGSGYCSNLLIDAVLRESAKHAQEAGLVPDFSLSLGALQGFSLSDVGVMLSQMLQMLGESHPGTEDTLRLRAQEFNGTLILVVSRRERLRSSVDDQMNLLRQMSERYRGCVEFTEKDSEIRLGAVLFRV